jgi:hypothetical protein
MTNLEKEYIHLSELLFVDGKEDAIQEIDEFGGLDRFEEEKNGDLLYIGKDGSIRGFNTTMLFDALSSHKLVEPIDFPKGFNVPVMSECVSLSKVRIKEYLQKLRGDIAAGAIAV